MADASGSKNRDHQWYFVRSVTSLDIDRMLMFSGEGQWWRVSRRSITTSERNLFWEIVFLSFSKDTRFFHRWMLFAKRVWTYHPHCRMFLLWFRRPFDSSRLNVEDPVRPVQLRQIRSQHWSLHLKRSNIGFSSDDQLRYLLTVLVNVVTLCFAFDKNEPKLLQGLCQVGWKVEKDPCVLCLWRSDDD